MIALMKKKPTLALVLAASITLYFISVFCGWGNSWTTVFKCIPTLLLLAGTAFSLKGIGEGAGSAGREYILGILALFFSFLGDLGGNLERLGGTTSFMLMIAGFLVAQVFYFTRALPLRDRGHYQYGLIIPLAVYVLVVGYIILSHIGGGFMAIGCAAYMLVLAAMGYFTFREKAALKWVLVVGAALFIISDSMIAINHFVVPVPGRRWTVMATYYAAQIMLNWRYAR